MMNENTFANYVTELMNIVIKLEVGIGNFINYFTDDYNGPDSSLATKLCDIIGMIVEDYYTQKYPEYINEDTKEWAYENFDILVDYLQYCWLDNKPFSYQDMMNSMFDAFDVPKDHESRKNLEKLIIVEGF